MTPRNLRQACILKWLCQNISDSTIKEWMGVLPSYNLDPYKEFLANRPSLSYKELEVSLN